MYSANMSPSIDKPVTTSVNGNANGGNIKPLHIIVIGAGLGGLAASIALSRAGHNVTVLEAAPQLGEVGAGIQMSPNVSRLLIRWGLEDLIGPVKVEPSEIVMRRWQTGERVGSTKLVPTFRENFDAPYWVIHRAHLHEALHQRALTYKVKIILNARVSNIDFHAPSVSTESNATYHADLIIGADGLKSVIRQRMLGRIDEPRVSRYCAYRATVPISKIQEDSNLEDLISSPKINVWLGPRRHVITYMIASGKTLNFVLGHVEDSPPSEWGDADQVRSEMLEQYKGWDPKIVKTLNMIEKVQRWPLASVKCPDSWLHPSRKVALLGDACHGMLPFMSQGAAMAIEDSACLARCLAQPDLDIATALELYEDLRKHRAERLQYLSDLNSHLIHLEDGPLQEARDRAMGPEARGEPIVRSSNVWTDPTLQCYVNGYDAEEVVDRAIAAKRAAKTAPVSKGQGGLEDEDVIDLNGRVIFKVGMDF